MPFSVGFLPALTGCLTGLGEFALINLRLINKTFENCRIYGPVVTTLKKDVLMSYCDFDAPIDSIFISTTNKLVMY